MDFRTRLNEQKSEVNPDAWNQMSEMLDHIQPNKKRRWWFFIFFFVFLLALYGLWNAPKWMMSPNETISLDNKSQQAELFDQVTNANKVDDSITNVLPGVSLKNKGASSDFPKSSNTFDAPSSSKSIISTTKESSPFVNVKTQKGHLNKSEIHNRKDINSDYLKQRTTSEIKKAEGHSFTSLVSKIDQNAAELGNTNDIDKSKIAFGSTSISTQSFATVHDDADTSEGKEITDIQGKEITLYQASNLINTLDSAANKRAMVRPLLELSDIVIVPISELKRDLPTISYPTKVIKKNAKMYYIVRAGYIYFNENPGYQIGLGIFRDQNNVIGFESEIVHSYGSMQDIEKGKPFTYERQTDFNLLVHLNLVRTQRHKISIELGSGWTFYNGVRVNQLSPDPPDVRKSNYYNYNGGFSYTFFINPKNLLGIRLGFVSYDDAVTGVTFRYGRKF